MRTPRSLLLGLFCGVLGGLTASEARAHGGNFSPPPSTPYPPGWGPGDPLVPGTRPGRGPITPGTPDGPGTPGSKGLPPATPGQDGQPLTGPRRWRSTVHGLGWMDWWETSADALRRDADRLVITAEGGVQTSEADLLEVLGR